jgi:hypothetical protein
MLLRSSHKLGSIVQIADAGGKRPCVNLCANLPKRPATPALPGSNASQIGFEFSNRTGYLTPKIGVDIQSGHRAMAARPDRESPAATSRGARSDLLIGKVLKNQEYCLPDSATRILASDPSHEL